MSETKNLKLKKHDNVSTNTSEFDIENYLNGNWDKIDDADGEQKKSIDNLDKKIQAEIIELKEENEALKNQFFPKTTEKAEMQHLDDSSGLKAKISIFGNSSQEKVEEVELLPQNPDAWEIGALSNGRPIDSDSRIRLKDFIAITDLNNYYAYVENTDYRIMNVQMYDENKSWIGNYSSKVDATIINSQRTDNINFLENTKYIKFALKTPDDSAISTFDITKIKPHLKHYGSPSRAIKSEITTVKDSIKIIKSNKNMLNTQKNASKTKYGVTITTDERGVVTLNGTSTGSFYIKVYDDLETLDSANLKKRDKKVFQKGKYIFEFKYISGGMTAGDGNINAYVRDTLSNTGNEISANISRFSTANRSVEFEVTEKIGLFVYFWTNSGITFDNYKIAFQIENSEIASEFLANEQEVFNLPLQKEFVVAGTYQDCFVKKDDEKWYEIHYTPKHILDGTENWANLNNSKSNTEIFELPSIKVKKNEYVELCDSFSTGKSVYNLDEEGIYVTTTGVRLRISNKVASTVAELKTYLASNNITLYSVATTVEDILCTAEQTEILEKLNATKTYKNETVVTTDSIAEIQIEYYGDLETLLKKAGAL